MAGPIFAPSKTRRIMQRQNVSVRELSRRLEERTGRQVEHLRTQLHGWLAGRHSPTLSYIEAIALSLGVTVDEVTEDPDDDEALIAVASAVDKFANEEAA